MKKLVSFISVFLSLLLIATPLCAGAETIDTLVVQVYNPAISYNGDTALDLSGLTVQLSGGSSSDGTLTQAFLDVFGGGALAGNAVLQFDSENLCAYLNGMENAYGIPTQTLIELVESIFDDGAASIPDVGSLMGIVTDLESWELPNQLMACASDFVENDLVIGEPETRTITLPSGDVTADYYPVTGDVTAYLRNIAKLIDEDPFVSALLTSANDGEPMNIAGIMDTIETTLEGGIAMGEDYEYYDFTLFMTTDGTTVAFNIGIVSLSDENGDTVDFALKFYPVDEEYANESLYLTATAVSDLETTNVTAHMGYDSEDEYSRYDIALALDIAADGKISINVNDSTGSISASVVLEDGYFELNVASDGETLSVYAEWDDSCNFSAGVSEDGNSLFTISFTPVEDDAYLFNGIISLSFADEYGDVYGIDCGIGLTVGSADTENTAIDPSNVIDISTLTDEDILAIEDEATVVLSGILSNLMQSVPGLQMLMEE